MSTNLCCLVEYGELYLFTFYAGMQTSCCYCGSFRIFFFLRLETGKLFSQYNKPTQATPRPFLAILA